MPLLDRLRLMGWVANPAVTADKFEGEIVLIHVQSGLYFSLRGAAVSLWEALATPVEQSALLALFGTLSENALKRVEEVLALFEAKGLVLESSGPFSVPAGVSFELPVVESYDDLADLITLDPIHDVSAEGWPSAAPKRQALT